MIAMLAMALAATPALTPSSKWQVDYATDSCRLSRGYGVGASNMTLVLEQEPLNEGAKIYLMLSNSRSIPTNGKAIIRVVPQGPEQNVNFDSWQQSERGLRIVKLWLLADNLSAVTAADGLQFGAGSIEVALAPGFTPAALAASSRCVADLERKWGLDPTEKDRVAVPAKGNPASWIHVADYPADAVRQRQHGTTKVVFAIGTDGRLSDCRTVASSGSMSLDAATCRAYVSRGRYTPAIGKDGKPMVTHKALSTNWTMP